MRPASPLSQLVNAYTPLARVRGAAERYTVEPRVIAQLAGTWNGTLFLSDSDRGTPFSLMQHPTSDLYRGTLAFPKSLLEPADVRLLEASDTTFVALAGPYFDPDMQDDILTLIEARRDGNRLWGNFCSRRSDGPRQAKRRFVAFRAG